jgi:PAS domain S-box-containing protein
MSESKRPAKSSAKIAPEAWHWWRALFEPSRQSTQLYAPNGECVAANRAWEEMWAASSASQNGYSLWADTQLRDCEQLPFFEQAFAGETVEISPFWYDPTVSQCEGRARWVQIFLQPLLSPAGEVWAVVAQQQDVTDLKHASDALRFLTGVSSALTAATDEKVLERVAELSVPYLADECWIHTLERDESIRRLADVAKSPEHISKYFVSPDLPVVRAAIERSRNLGFPTDQPGAHSYIDDDFPGMDEFRKRGVTAALCLPLRLGDEALGAIIFLSQTPGFEFHPVHLVLAEELAHRAALALDNARLCRDALNASQAKDEFLTVAAHELRTPLTSLLGWTHLLTDTRLDANARQDAAHSIERNAWSLVQLVNDIVDASRISSGRVRLNIQPLYAASVLEAALINARPAAEAKNITLEVEIQPHAGLVSGDANRLQQVAWILISNAIKFTPVGGRVLVLLTSDGEFVRLCVSDTGVGINPEVLPFVWERWIRTSHPLTRQQDGLGLNLTNARNLVEMHGGRVRAESEGEGQGASFIVEIPRLNVTSGTSLVEERAPDEQEQARIQRVRGAKVLWVGNQKSTREVVERALSRHEVELRLESTADAALETLTKWRPNVLIVDVAMPGQDGYALIRRVRALSPEEGGQIPAIAFTQHWRIIDRLRALSAGYQIHIATPIHAAEVAAVVADLVAPD